MPSIGIIREPRRPPGWHPPGPPPACTAGRSDLWPRPGEDLCYLAGEWRILQRLDGHRWSLDDLVTAWFAALQVAGTPPARIADLGCGIGAVLMLLAWRFPAARCLGVEAQAGSVELARRSLGWNGIEDRCEVRLGDLRDPEMFPEGGVFDLVTGTPPYLRPGTATEPRGVQRGPCHFEQRGGIEEYCAVAARLVTRNGRFATCAAAAQADCVSRAAATAGMAVERRRDVIPRQGKGPLFSVYCLRHAGEVDEVTVERPLVVRDASGRRTPECLALREEMGMPP